MKPSTAEIYRCPVTGKELQFTSTKEVDGKILEGSFRAGTSSYEVRDGIPDFLYPSELMQNDAEFKQKYDKTADQYDVGLDWLFKSFSEDENTVRSSMLDLLGIKPGDKVLEVGCGTGKDSILIARRLNGRGQLFLQELSIGMLNLCRKRLGDEGYEAEFLTGNGSYLPFPDGYFDAVFHFGGINTFDEKARAFKEFTRVTKSGGTVVVGDESVPPWLREKDFGKILMNANPLYKYEVPLALLPESARNVSVRWLLGNCFYVIRYEVGSGCPPLDVDLPIPGKGDSLRIRYQAMLGAPL